MIATKPGDLQQVGRGSVASVPSRNKISIGIVGRMLSAARRKKHICGFSWANPPLEAWGVCMIPDFTRFWLGPDIHFYAR